MQSQGGPGCEIGARADSITPRETGIRVLEIGAGTGGTTSAVLPGIKDIVELYVFTDTSPLLVAESASRFKGDSRFGEKVTFKILDIETSPSDQGFKEHSYDLVIAANVLHATRDLRESLEHSRRLLRPDGFLIALEGSRRERLLDLVFGITDGWWRFEDTELRPDYPLLNGEKWCDLLSESGFNGPRLVPHECDSQALQSQLVILAEAGGSQRESTERTSDTRSRSGNEPVPVDLQSGSTCFMHLLLTSAGRRWRTICVTASLRCWATTPPIWTSISPLAISGSTL